jgi:hypothetical protein
VADDARKSQRARWSSIGLILLGAYVVGFGPFVWVLVKCDASRDSVIGRVANLLLTPHAWGMERSYTYYRYGCWWATLADPSIGALDYATWRDHRDFF